MRALVEKRLPSLQVQIRAFGFQLVFETSFTWQNHKETLIELEARARFFSSFLFVLLCFAQGGCVRFARIFP